MAISAGDIARKGGRFDIAVVGQQSGECEIEWGNHLGIPMLSMPIEEYPLFHYLNVKNASLVPLIANQLRQMKEEGRIDKIWNSHLKSLMCQWSSLAHQKLKSANLQRRVDWIGFGRAVRLWIFSDLNLLLNTFRLSWFYGYEINIPLILFYK